MPDRDHPRILIVTPEVTYLPDRMGSIATCLSAKAGGLADVSSALVCELYRQGADVHVAIPNYKAIFGECLAEFIKREQSAFRRILPDEKLHLAEDHVFSHRHRIYSGDGEDNVKLALAFQREVINNIIPRVEPDLIHCNDWMTGLIPGMARQAGIPSLFSVHNIHTMKILLSDVEDRGIDPTRFWDYLYYERMPHAYDETRASNPVDFLASGIFSSSFVNTVSPNFLTEIITGQHNFVPSPVRSELIRKWEAGQAVGILNAPDPTFNPASDPHLVQNYGSQNHKEAKKVNKIALQTRLDLIRDPLAPLLFWPSRLDPVQKGCQLLSDILYRVVSGFGAENLQIVFVADGEYQQVFKDIVGLHGIQRRVAVHDFEEALEHLAYGASDFILMPSRFEPCGLPQMIGPIYGALPIAHDTGGIHDTITHLHPSTNTGNGFVFKTYDSSGLFWAIGEAMHFFRLSGPEKARQLSRIMGESALTFSHRLTAEKYIGLYENLVRQPVVGNS